jgi:hypothetical protein
MRAALAAAMLGILLAGMPGAAAAAELGAAGLRVTPFLTERVEYESNILQSPSNAQDDAIVRTVPGVLLELPLGSHRLDLCARVEVLNFVDLPRYNAEHVLLLGTLALRFPSSLVVTVKEDFAYTTEPPGTELTGRVRSTTNVVAPSVEYDVGRRVALGADYTWAHVDFERAFAPLDRDEHTGGLSAFFRVALKTDLFANVAYGVKEFRSAPIRDVDRYIGVVGIRGALTDTVTTTFRAGVEVREPRQAHLTAYRGMVGSGDWVYRAGPHTQVTLVGEYFVAESAFATNFWYLANFLTVAAEHAVTPTLGLSGRLYVGTNEYPNKAMKRNGAAAWRSDEIFGGGLAADYQVVRWLALGADYTYTQRRSSFDAFDFADHVVGFKLTLSF